jgi:hypothetical protein
LLSLPLLLTCLDEALTSWEVWRFDLAATITIRRQKKLRETENALISSILHRSSYSCLLRFWLDLSDDEEVLFEGEKAVGRGKVRELAGEETSFPGVWGFLDDLDCEREEKVSERRQRERRDNARL